MEKNQGKTTIQPKHAGGRPLEYTKEIGDLICELVSIHGMGLKRLCKEYEALPSHTTIKRWRHKIEAFRAQYAQAKIDQADILAEECLEIADDLVNNMYQQNVVEDEEHDHYKIDNGIVNCARLRIDARKWLASKLLPKQYGDKLLLEQKTEENEKLKEQLLALRADLDEKHQKDF
ncbi:hypothetical protein UFOVP93_20 [uncultured Caudovirales phage]|uniref:Terminase small subunit n=1 Tax=uncultured Caudovirales phage TaxID=2100421 RepID=A0A6J5L224_9CAUD|nr:hypothetical protein UFOVP93_20 [uncultured Caudovirales phage]